MDALRKILTKTTQSAAHTAVTREPSVYTFFDEWLENTLETARIALLRRYPDPNGFIDYKKPFGPDGITYRKFVQWINGPGDGQIYPIIKSEFSKTLRNFTKANKNHEDVAEFFANKENAPSLYKALRESIIRALHIKVYFKTTLDEKGINSVVKQMLLDKYSDKFYMIKFHFDRKEPVLPECSKAFNQAHKTINRIVRRVFMMAQDPGSRNFRQAFRKIRLEFPEIPEYAVMKTDYELNKMYNLIKYRYIEESMFENTVAATAEKLYDMFGVDLYRIEVYSRGILKTAETVQESHKEQLHLYQEKQQSKKPSYAPVAPESPEHAKAKARAMRVKNPAKVKIPRASKPVEIDIRIPNCVKRFFRI